MGTRLNISQPMVIDTLLTPLTDSLILHTNDVTEQWYDVGTGTWNVNRETTPLTITPMIDAYDPDSGQKLSISSFNSVTWTAMEGDTEKVIPVTDQTDEDYGKYEKKGNNLIVKKNVVSTPISIRCEVNYADPRSLEAYIVADTIILTCNKDATAVFPVVKIMANKFTPYNPLAHDRSTGVRPSSLFTFNAKATLEGQDITNNVYFEWYATDKYHNEETLIDAKITAVIDQETHETMDFAEFPCYVSGQGTKNLVLDAMGSEEVRLVLRARYGAQPVTISSPMTPSKDYAVLGWDVPKVDAITASKEGSAVNTTSGEKTFYNILNMRGGTIHENIVREFIATNWKYRFSNSSTEYDAGWGSELTLNPETLYNRRQGGVIPSTDVHAEIYLRGAKEKVYMGSSPVFFNGQPVFARNVTD